MSTFLHDSGSAENLQYAGFWRRNWAMSLDTLLLLPLALVLHWATYARSPYSWMNRST